MSALIVARLKQEVIRIPDYVILLAHVIRTRNPAELRALLTIIWKDLRDRWRRR